MDTLNKVDADFLHQLDMDYKPLTSSLLWTPKSYEEESKLNIGDIVTIRPDLTTSSSTLKEQYKVISYNTKNGQYGIVPARSLFNLPMYFNREELILVSPVNKGESFLYKKGNLVLFRYKNLTGLNKTLTGQILSRFTINKSMTEPYPVREKYYQIKDINSCNLEYIVKESDIIERLCTSTSESEQQKAVNMENSTEEHKIRIGDIVSVLLPRGPFDSSTVNQYKVKDIDIKTGKYRIVHVYTPSGPSEYYDRKDLILRRKADEEKPFLFQKGDIVSFKLLWCNDVRIGQIEEMLRAIDNCYKIRDLKDSCLYLVKESNIERIASTIHESNSIEASNKAELLSAAKSLENTGKIIDSINEEKPLNIKIAKKQIKLNFKN